MHVFAWARWLLQVGAPAGLGAFYIQDAPRCIIAKQYNEAKMHLGAFCAANAPDRERETRGARRARGKSTLLHAKLNEDNQLYDAT